MRKLIVNELMSLDGVGQASGGADEDRRGGFADPADAVAALKRAPGDDLHVRATLPSHAASK